ncbi:hypothetical protein COY14_04160 [Candidatus Roizmanbacteria bacterium CG_4_10_14_0_2_um_filter_36_9]|uniref:Glucose-6-phosphate isomerase n=1 Tax=Candidatus Roizmanbacteria bacterium CG_4_10_14_0_2_um_filter_36_9 TaxID=1974823 RepID=A0A2M7U2U0_9BACT|nr:MAG: hypothetical protein COY14_04160 [Candidatus Roizmanbacteria bacterium CG_4_10_14_0_2_um_filter_36_9]
MKFLYKRSSQIDEKELIKQMDFLETYQSHLQDVISIGGYEADEASINLPSDKKLLENILEMVEKKKSTNLKYIIVVGIGGSNLGTKAIYDALYGYFDTLRADRFPKMIFLDTQVASVLSNLKILLSTVSSPDEVLINVISKSGSTTETMANFEVVFEMLKDRFSTIASRVVFTTNEGSKLHEVGNIKNISVLNLPSSVGGRYSIFSAVGLFPLALLGVNIKKLTSSAANMRDMCVNSQGFENPSLVSASILFTQSQQGKSINDNFIFAPELESLGKWYRQLMGESIGKDNKGITPTVSVGSTDLHSVGQLYLGGPKDKTTTFIYSEAGGEEILVPENTLLGLVDMIEGKKILLIIKAIIEGTKLAYAKQGIPFMEIVFSSINIAEIAAFMQFKMIEMMYLGKLFNVNAFDQPHVELYKTEVKKILEG